MKTLIKPINKDALFSLKAYRGRLTPQQYKTLRGQVLSGDDKGAMKGLKKVIKRGKAKKM